MLDDYKTQKFGGLGKEECIATAYSTCYMYDRSSILLAFWYLTPWFKKKKSVHYKILRLFEIVASLLHLNFRN